MTNADGRVTETSEERKRTAYHEAGHGVAHFRFEVLQGRITIKSHGDNLGSSTAEGKDHVYDAEDAQKQVLCYCAGYAALIAAGYSEDDATQGADDDFENAAELIEKWALPGALEEWQSQAVELMSSPENIHAVDSVAKSLMRYEALDADYMDLLVDRADGNLTEEDWRQVISMQYPGMLA